jgi:hypothetical protein
MILEQHRGYAGANHVAGAPHLGLNDDGKVAKQAILVREDGLGELASTLEIPLKI